MTALQRELQQSSDNISFALICSLVLSRLLTFAFNRYMSILPLGDWRPLLMVLISLISLGVPILLLSLGHIVRVQKSHVHPSAKLIFGGFALFLAFCGISIFIDSAVYRGLFILGYTSALPYINLPTTLFPFISSVLSLVIIPALLEEFLFRGQILTLLEPYGTRFSIFISALLFALLPIDLIRIPTRLLAGVLLGWLVYRGCPIGYVIFLRLVAGLYAMTYFLQTLGIPLARTIWYVLLALSALSLTICVLLLLIRQIFRRRASRDAQPVLTDEQRVFRYFISIPSIALLISIGFLGVQTLVGW